MHVSPQLSDICRRRAGFDPAGLSPAQIEDRVPRIIEAIEAERRSTLQNVRVIQKSAMLAQQFNDYIPSPSLTRDEYIDQVSTPSGSDDPNAVLESIIPW